MLFLVGPLAGLKSNSKLRKLRTISFFMSYVLFFLSWTLSDLALPEGGVQAVEKVMRYAAYLLFALNLLFADRTRKEWVCFTVMALLSAGYFFATKELFLLSLTVFVMISLDEDISDIFKVSLCLLIGLVAVTLLLCGVGILENRITIRGVTPADTYPRYALGFYHSNVLPLLLFYILVYLGIIKKYKFHPAVLLAALAVSVILYIFCNSRTAFLATLLLLGLYFVAPRIHLSSNSQSTVFGIARNIIAILSLISLVLSLLYPIHNPVLAWINTHLMSERLTLGYQKLVSQGLYFINMMPFEQYIQDKIIIDNAYMSMMIRYGVISVVILGLANYFGCEKYKKQPLALMVFILVCCVNFIDNDLLTYSCFPFLLAAYNRNMLNTSVTGKLKQKDLVSVIMSTYNEEEQQLSASIESILSQSYANFEFIIVNDNPNNDNLRATLTKFANKDNRIVLVENPQNMGLVASLNRAITYARGRFIARMDADDIAAPNRLFQQLLYLKNNDLDFVGGQIHYIDEESRSLQYTLKVPPIHEQIKRGMLWGNCVPHPTWLVKREVYETLGGYRQIPHCEDYDFVLRAFKLGYQLGNVPLVVLKYRVRTTSISVSNSAEQNLIRNYLAANRKSIFMITEEMVKQQSGNPNHPYYLYGEKKNAVKDALKGKNTRKLFTGICLLVTDKYFWFWLIEKVRFYIYR